MEIKIVGWHLDDAPYVCQECDEKAAFVVVYNGDYDTFNLCSGCASKHTVVEDQIAEIFKRLGL